MSKNEIISRFCKLANTVQDKKFAFSRAADCFCGENNSHFPAHFQFEDDVIDFIEKAVMEKLGRESPSGLSRLLAASDAELTS